MAMIQDRKLAQQKELPPMTWTCLEKQKKGRQLWKKVAVTSPDVESNILENKTPRNELAVKKKSMLNSMPKKASVNKMKMEIDRLWETSQRLVKKEQISEDDLEKLRRIIQEAVDLSGRIRMMVRDKELYTDEDVAGHAKDINSLQLLFHSVVEIWTKVNSPEKEKYIHTILTDMMELASDVCSVYGEVMSIFLQRFGLDIVPLLRPVHGLYYSISIHCRYHAPTLVEEDLDELKDQYNSFLTGLLGLLRSTKVLLKRLRFDTDVARNRRRLVQSNIARVLTAIQSMVKDGRKCSTNELIEAIEKVGSLCTDIFFIIGKTAGIAELLELGEGVIAMDPAEVLGEVAHSDIERCSIEQRPVFMRGIDLDQGGSFISDLFIQTGSMFNPSQKITLRMPFSGGGIPPNCMLKVKLKMGDDWFDTPGTLVEDMIEFKTKFMQGFIAAVEYMTVIKELNPSGFCYTCPEDPRVRINFPAGCVEKLTHLSFKLIQINRSRMFDYKEQCRNLCKTILAVSDCIKVDHEEDVVFGKPIVVHMPIPNDIDDPESEIVIFRSRDDGEIELIPKRTAMLCPSSQNCYTFQVQSFSGIAIGKVKKDHLRKNRASVVEEYQLYMEDYYICNLLTFLDKSLLHVGMVKVLVECVEKRFAKKALRRRAKEGLFEISGSRSPNLKLKNEDIICIEAEGNIERMKEIPLENYFIVFLSSARDNFRSFPVEQRKDPDGRAYGVLNFFKDNEEEQKFLHAAIIDANRYLLGVTDRAKTAPNTSRGATGLPSSTSLGGSWTSRKTAKSSREQTQYRTIFDSVPVLSHQSLLALSTYIKIDTMQSISYELGIPYEDIVEMKVSDQPPVIMNFEVLWKWRGHDPKKNKVQVLARAFRVCGHPAIALKIEKAQDEKRALTKDDFNKISCKSDLSLKGEENGFGSPIMMTNKEDEVTRQALVVDTYKLPCVGRERDQASARSHVHSLIIGSLNSDDNFSFMD